jgi:hypothetical protein
MGAARMIRFEMFQRRLAIALDATIAAGLLFLLA